MHTAWVCARGHTHHHACWMSFCLCVLVSAANSLTIRLTPTSISSCPARESSSSVLAMAATLPVAALSAAAEPSGSHKQRRSPLYACPAAQHPALTPGDSAMWRAREVAVEGGHSACKPAAPLKRKPVDNDRKRRPPEIRFQGDSLCGGIGRRSYSL